MAPGTLVSGRFEVTRELGRGGFGVVVEARDTVLGRAVALKFFRPDLPVEALDASGLAEADAIARLSHPNILQIYDRGTSEVGPYLVLELLSGEPLARRLERGPLTPVQAARVALGIARGLAHAHVRGVVHRDLKPGNVFLCSEGVPKVLDFGLAHLVHREGRHMGGTPGWMAPEQRRGAPGDERTDVWALGAILARMLAGADPTSTKLSVPGAPDLEALVEAMLAPDPARRPRDASRVVEALEPLVRALEVDPDAAVAARPAWRVLRRRTVRVLAVSLLAAVTVAGVAGGALVLGSRLQRPASAPAASAGRLVIAVADFDNLTGDPELDPLSGLLVTSLEQSRHLELLSRSRMADLLLQLGHEPPFQIDEALGRELAAKAGAHALLAASVLRLGSAYAIELRAIEPGSGRFLFTLREQAGQKEALFGAIDRLSQQTRERLQEAPEEVAGSRVEVAAAITSSLEAYQHYFRGRDATADGAYADALAEMRQAIQADPRFGLAYLHLAFLGHWTGLLDRAERQEALRRAIEQVDRLPIKERLTVQAGKAYEEGKDGEVDALTDRGVEAFPGDGWMIYLAADLRYHGFHSRRGSTRDLEETLPLFERALSIDPLDAQSYDHTIGVLSRLGRRSELLERAEAWAKLAPSDAAADAVAMALVLNGRASEAEKVLPPPETSGEPVFYAARVAALLATGRASAAERLVRSAPPAAWPVARFGLQLRLVEALLAQGRYRDALEETRRMPEDASLPEDAGFPAEIRTAVQIGRGAPAEAWEEARPVVEARGGVGLIPLYLAEAGELSRAETALGLLVPGSRQAAFALAVLAWRAGRLDEAALRLSALEKSKYQTDRVLASGLLGELEVTRGRDREAIAALERYQAAPPSDEPDVDRALRRPRALLLLAAAHGRTGNLPRARAALDELARAFARADANLPVGKEARALRARLGRP